MQSLSRTLHSVMILSLLLQVLLIPLPVHAEDSVCQASLLIETRTGCILSEENADTPLPVGSLAKLMTAYLTQRAILQDQLSLTDTLTAGDCVTGTKGAVIWLEKGDTITVEELLMGLLAGNANDAAAVLAEAVSGNTDAFVMDMNAAAYDLGMRNTHFTSPQGYDDTEAYSTAKDLGILACAILENDIMQPYLTTWRTMIRDESVELVNENTFTRTMDGCRGLKAAHSDAAGYCLMAACIRGDMTCTAIVLGCTDEDIRFSEAKRLLNAGFAGYGITLPSLAEEFLSPLKIQGGTESAVLLKAAAIPELAVRQNGEQLHTVIVLPDFIQAPVSVNQVVGTVYFYHSDTLLCSTDLLATQDVPERTFAFALRKMLRFLFT